MLSPDDNLIAVDCFDRQCLYVFEISSGKLRARLSGEFDEDIHEFQFSPDSQFLVVNSETQSQLFPMNKGWVESRLAPIKRFGRRISRSNSAAPQLPVMVPKGTAWPLPFWATSKESFSRCSTWLVALRYLNDFKHQEVELCNLKTGERVKRTTELDSCAISSDGKRLLTQSKGNIEVFELGDGLVETRLPVKDSLEASPVAEVWNAPSEFMTRFSRHSNGQPRNLSFDLSIWERKPFDTMSGPLYSTFRCWASSERESSREINFYFEVFGVNPTGMRAATLEVDDAVIPKTRTLVQWRDFETGACVRLRKNDQVLKIDELFVPNDGGLVAMCGTNLGFGDRELAGWKRSLVKLLSRLPGHDWRQILFPESFRFVELWDGPNGEFIQTLSNQSGVGFAPDGKTFVTQDDDYHIHFWDIRPRRDVMRAMAFAVAPAIVATGLLILLASFVRFVSRRARLQWKK